MNLITYPESCCYSDFLCIEPETVMNVSLLALLVGIFVFPIDSNNQLPLCLFIVFWNMSVWLFSYSSWRLKWLHHTSAILSLCVSSVFPSCNFFNVRLYICFRDWNYGQLICGHRYKYLQSSASVHPSTISTSSILLITLLGRNIIL